ncbi:MAG: GNAT family N-acetyltransferase [Bacteriovoracaceae bacterium]|nr:GNAT family N-acetyltransferase [Bacteriovoracaceae bacterium]
MWIPPTIETKRLILRDLRESDAQDIFSYAQKPIISKYTLWEPHQSLEDSIDYIKNYAGKYYQEGTPEPFAIELKENKKMIGGVGCFWVSKKNKMMELAYVISDEYWGQGIMVEASQAIIDYCFKLYAIERMQCRCKEENTASSRVMEKLGMTYEGTLRSAINHRNRFWNMKYYSLLRRKWKAAKANEAYVRRAEFGDEEGIHLAHMRSIKEVCSRDYNEEQVNAWGGREFNYDSKKRLIEEQAVWVIEKSGKIEGYGLLFKDKDKPVAEIGALYFTPEVNGKGFGKEIVFYMKEFAKISGVKEIYLSSTKTSKGFYEAQGFKQYCEDDSTIIGGVAVEGHPMKLSFK